MVAFSSLAVLALAANAMATVLPRDDAPATPKDDHRKGKGNGSECGKKNIFLTGLPWDHPLVIAQGYDPKMVEAALKADFEAAAAAGYNIKGVLHGPEEPESVIIDELRNTPGIGLDDWTATVLGFGVRGSNSTVLTTEFTDEVQLLHDTLPHVPILFNHGPTSTLWAVQQKFPLPAGTNCAAEGKPGKNYGFAYYCKICGNNGTASATGTSGSSSVTGASGSSSADSTGEAANAGEVSTGDANNGDNAGMNGDGGEEYYDDSE